MRKIIGFVVVVVIIIGAFVLIGNRGQGLPVDDLKPRLSSPVPNQVIHSPLSVAGEAPGFWFFEASLPVKLLDGNGKTLAVAPAQAQGDWQTSNFVPFLATLSFENPSTPTGTLVIAKDNPSGLPENAQEISFPVRFEL